MDHKKTKHKTHNTNKKDKKKRKKRHDHKIIAIRSITRKKKAPENNDDDKCQKEAWQLPEFYMAEEGQLDVGEVIRRRERERDREREKDDPRARSSSINIFTCATQDVSSTTVDVG